MKCTQNKLIVFVFILLIDIVSGTSQENMSNPLSYDVLKVYPPISITKEKLNSAETLLDLNNKYPESWVKEYVSVEILTNYNGQERKAQSENGTLSQEQKDMMMLADVGSNILVDVRYLPDNTVEDNDIKKFDFKFSVDPEIAAKFSGGNLKLKQYLKDNLIKKVSNSSFKQYQLAIVKFTVDEEGNIVDPHIFSATEDIATDALLLKSICNMPKWKPARYADGTAVSQDFALTVGDIESCTANLINLGQGMLAINN